MVWASRWSVALRAFYRQILSLTYSFFSLKLPPPACPGLVYFSEKISKQIFTSQDDVRSIVKPRHPGPPCIHRRPPGKEPLLGDFFLIQNILWLYGIMWHWSGWIVVDLFCFFMNFGCMFRLKKDFWTNLEAKMCSKPSKIDQDLDITPLKTNVCFLKIDGWFIWFISTCSFRMVPLKEEIGSFWRSYPNHSLRHLFEL